MLPPLFEVDEYFNCLEKNNVFCKVTVKLQPTKHPSSLWPTIVAATKDTHLFDRSLLHRGLCIPRQEARNDEAVAKYSERVINERIAFSNLSSEVKDFICDSGDVLISTFDKIVGLSFIFYFSLIIFATLYERRTQGRKISATGNIIMKLSIFYNWKKATNNKRNDDYMRLKSIEGIRFYNIMYILILHSAVSYIFQFIANPEYLEELMTNYLVNIFKVLSVFVIHTFFLISSCLLTIHIYRIYKENGELSLKHLTIFLINRYFRLTVLSTLLICVSCTSWPRFLSKSVNFHAFVQNEDACAKNWLPALFFFHNIFYLKDMCIPVTWYLSVDFQLYVTNALIFYVMFKYKLNEKKVLGFMFVLSCFMQGVVIYMNEMDTIFRPHIRNMETYYWMRSFSFMVMYTSTYSTWSTSLVGVIMGVVYFKNKHNVFEKNKILNVLWALLFPGLPLLAIMLSMEERSGISSAIVGSLVKPLYSLGIGIGILGMSHNLGGIVKRICEWKYIVLLSNFTYSIYLIHMMFCFLHSDSSGALIELGAIPMVKNALWVVFFSITFGIILSLTIEQPGLMCQKMLLPQVRKYSKNEDKKQ